MTQLKPSVAEPSSQAIKEHVKAMLRKLLDRLQNDTPAGAAPQAGWIQFVRVRSIVILGQLRSA